jgi:hypothetical protein
MYLHTHYYSLEAQKAEVVAQANAQKALLAKEVKHLRSELDSSKSRGAAPLNTMAVSEDQVCMHVYIYIYIYIYIHTHTHIHT